MGSLYLIRHGQASFGAANYDALSELGREQASRIGQWLHDSGIHLDHAIAGSLVRQQDTARLALEAWAKASGKAAPTVDTDPALNEYDHEVIFQRGAAAEAKSTKPGPLVSREGFGQLFENAVRRWAGGQHDHDYPESLPAFYERAASATRRLQSRGNKGETVAAFSSGGTISMICGHALGLPPQRAIRMNFMIANCAVSRFYYDQERFTLSYMNNHGYFEAFEGGRLVSFR